MPRVSDKPAPAALRPRAKPARPASAPRGGRAIQDRLSLAKLLRRRARRLLRPGLWVLAGCVVLLLGLAATRRAESGGMLGGLRQALVGLAGTSVQHVVIEGRSNTPEPLLHAALGVMPGQSLLGFSVEAARQRIETLSWVAHATVERRYPGTLVVSLVERTPFAIWQNQGRFALIGRNGQLVADQDLARFRQLPLVVGPDAPAHAAALLDALATQPALAARISAAVRVGERRWNLVLANGITIKLPEGHEDVALARLAELQATHALLDRPLSVVDLRLPDRLVIRPRNDAEAPEPAPANGKHPA